MYDQAYPKKKNMSFEEIIAECLKCMCIYKKTEKNYINIISKNILKSKCS